MDAWNGLDGTEFDSGPQMSASKWSEALETPILAARDDIYDHHTAVAPVIPAPEEPELEISPEQVKCQFFYAVCKGDLPKIQASVETEPLLILSLYNGYPPLVFAVVLNQLSAAQYLLNDYLVDPDEPGLAKPYYTPLMWAVHFDNLPMAKLLMKYHADPKATPHKETQVSAASLVTEATPAVYLHFKYHNILQTTQQPDFVYVPQTFGLLDDTYEDDLVYKIRMLKIGANSLPEPLDYAVEESGLGDSDREEDLLNSPQFDYTKAVPGQYIKHTDLDIPSLLDYIFGLRLKSRALQHDVRVPAAVVFQLIHYSHSKVGVNDLTTFVFDTFIARVRSVTNTMSGVIGVANTQGSSTRETVGDIVSLSYWLSVIQFLHLHLTRADLYREHGEFLQSLISVTQSLVSTLSFSINSRLDDLVEDCLLDFTNLVDVSQTTYAKDWNFLKEKKTPNSYDDIIDMLYPPSEEQLRMPSPVRYLQVLGALDYVLSLHMVHPLLRFEAYSQVFYHINATLFNRVISTSKYCSRARAIQIRLNISALEDWLRAHNSRIYKPDRLGGLSLLVDSDNDYTFKLTGLLKEEDNPKDPHCLGFLYKTLYHVGRTQLNPLIELLQWLQVVTGLKDEETFVTTVNELDNLNYSQLFKVTKKMYRYEVDEPKVPKSLVQYLKKLVVQEGDKQIDNSQTSYLSQSSFLLKEQSICIDPNYVFGIALPNLNELIMSFGAGLGGINKAHAKKYQPNLPTSVLDDLDEILLENRSSVNDTFAYESGSDEASDKDSENPLKKNTGDSAIGRESMLYKKVVSPLEVHPNYGHDEIDTNPW